LKPDKAGKQTRFGTAATEKNPMLPSHLDSVTAKYLEDLCNNRTPESQTLEFKGELPGRDAKAKNEFLKDVSAIANAQGGDLIYGVQEVDGCASALAPITAESVDDARRRLGQILDAGIEPRIIGLQFRDVPVAGGYILILRVPASFIGPHRYRLEGGHSRFVVRNGVYTSELTYDQLRSAFEKNPTFIDRARQFREQRLGKIIAGDTWKPLPPGPLCVTHIIPISGIVKSFSLDIQRLFNSQWTSFYLHEAWRSSSLDRSTNLDGLVCAPVSSQSQVNGYLQLFRSGAAELLCFGGSQNPPDQNFKSLIPSGLIADFFIASLKTTITELVKLGLTGPIVFGISFLNTKNHSMWINQHYLSSIADREHMILPEVWIDHVELITDFEDLLRPSLDILWQSFGQQRCPFYDEQGKWRGTDLR
jgi:hypothetical protein